MLLPPLQDAVLDVLLQRINMGAILPLGAALPLQSAAAHLRQSRAGEAGRQAILLPGHDCHYWPAC